MNILIGSVIFCVVSLMAVAGLISNGAEITTLKKNAFMTTMGVIGLMYCVLIISSNSVS